MNKAPNSLNRISYLFFSLTVAATIISIFSFFHHEEIVYVDSLKLFASYKGSIKAKAEYEKKLAQWKANVDTLTKELNTSISKYQKEKSGMSAKEKKLSEELLGAKQQQLESYRSAVSENATKEDQAVTGQVTKEINDFLMHYGDTHGYDYILGATNTGNIVFARKGKNITEDVIAELNGQYSGGKK